MELWREGLQTVGEELPRRMERFCMLPKHPHIYVCIYKCAYDERRNRWKLSLATEHPDFVCEDPVRNLPLTLTGGRPCANLGRAMTGIHISHVFNLNSGTLGLQCNTMWKYSACCQLDDRCSYFSTYPTQLRNFRASVQHHVEVFYMLPTHPYMYNPNIS